MNEQRSLIFSQRPWTSDLTWVAWQGCQWALPTALTEDPGTESGRQPDSGWPGLTRRRNKIGLKPPCTLAQVLRDARANGDCKLRGVEPLRRPMASLWSVGLIAQESSGGATSSLDSTHCSGSPRALRHPLGRRKGYIGRKVV